VRSPLAHVTLASAAVIVGVVVIGASPGSAQTRVTSFDELRSTLAAGDAITIVPTDGDPIAGRLMRLGTVDLDVRLVDARAPRGRGPHDVTVPLDAIRSLERRRDPARNGAALGAGVGAGFGGAMFLYATIIDRNEIDEWAASYVGAAVVCTGIGALIGWAIDAAHSKPHVRFDGSSAGRTRVSVQPAYSSGRGITLTVSIAR
jgi:hypothetical protein